MMDIQRYRKVSVNEDSKWELTKLRSMKTKQKQIKARREKKIADKKEKFFFLVRGKKAE